MTENFDHKIRRLELENFTCFTKAEMNFSSGINVFIGENGTGKTHVLKALYALTFKNPNVDNWNTKYLTDASNLKVNQQDVSSPLEINGKKLYPCR